MLSLRDQLMVEMGEKDNGLTDCDNPAIEIGGLELYSVFCGIGWPADKSNSSFDFPHYSRMITLDGVNAMAKKLAHDSGDDSKKQRRRGDGEGTIDQRADGIWRARPQTSEHFSGLVNYLRA
jgi:hypothetical protein